MNNTRIRGLLVASAAALVLAGCGGGDDESSPVSDGGLTPVSTHVMPIVDSALFYVALEEGYFEDHGLDVSFEETLQGGAVTIPAVTSGESDFGFSNSPALITAYTNGLDLPIIADASASNGNPDRDTAGVVVAADSDIESIADLAGRQVAVNTLNSIQDTSIRAAVTEEGADPDTIEFAEVPFPDQIGAITNGDVEAGYMAEPFVTLAEDAGLRYLGSPHAVISPAQNISVFFTSRTFAEENPQIVEAFAAAISDAASLSQEDPDAVREVLSTYMDITPEVQAALVLPAFPESLTEDEIQFQIDLLAGESIIPESFPAADIIVVP
ncbi:ABC-type nitrate/sulfonate/bicarbonate transport systems periplasmic components-like protein [Actinomycetales bacterium JB111]|nr:ABC-type nitrate/sulfonate/bicarbonate transport systems periplasmic components-like protein [Actinomycetales bacterium JB111]